MVLAKSLLYSTVYHLHVCETYPSRKVVSTEGRILGLPVYKVLDRLDRYFDTKFISNLLRTLCPLCKAGVGSDSVASSLQKRISIQQMTTPNSELSKKQQKGSSAGKEEFGTSNR